MVYAGEGDSEIPISSVDREDIDLLFHFNGDMTLSSVCVFRLKLYFHLSYTAVLVRISLCPHLSP